MAEQEMSQPAKTIEAKSSPNTLSLLSILLALAALGGCGFLYLQMHSHQSNSDAHIAQMSAEAASKYASIDNYRALEQQQYRQAEQLRAFEQEKKQNNTPAHHAIKASKTYVEMAQVRLETFQDASTALQLLNWAEHTIKDVPDSSAGAIIDEIKKIKVQISNLGFVDKALVYKKILKLANSPLPWAQNIDMEPGKQEEPGIKALLKDMIRVQHHENKPLLPVLDKAAQLQYEQSLHLLLYTAASALVNNNNEIYQDSLKQAATLLAGLFNSNPFGAEFEELTSIETTPSLPSFDALNKAFTEAL